MKNTFWAQGYQNRVTALKRYQEWITSILSFRKCVNVEYGELNTWTELETWQFLISSWIQIRRKKRSWAIKEKIGILKPEKATRLIRQVIKKKKIIQYFSFVRISIREVEEFVFRAKKKVKTQGKARKHSKLALETSSVWIPTGLLATVRGFQYFNLKLDLTIHFLITLCNITYILLVCFSILFDVM